MRTNLLRVRLAIVLCFVIVLVALGRIQLVERSELVRHPANRYTIAKENRIKRGEIFDRNRVPLAVWTEEGIRYYSLGSAGGHPIGYSSSKLGSSGVEAWFSSSLLGEEGSLGIKNFWQRLAGEQETGYNIQLTIDANLQEYGYSLLGGHRGALVAIRPKTGEILALISSPGFDPNDLSRKWDDYTGNPDNILFNRAISGTYPPGSTFKLIVGAAALEIDPELLNREFDCPGYIQLEGRQLTCHKAHGRINFMDGIAYSCNVVFVQLGLEIGESRLRKQAEAFGFEGAVLEGVPVKKSSLGDSPLTVNGLGETAIGQGKVLATPLQMAMVTAAIANEGISAEPVLMLGRALPGEDFPSRRPHGATQTRIMSRETAEILKEAMVGTVTYGTGWQAQIAGTKVGGKTGSAENPHGQAHAWFVGFAPADSPEIAVAVILENAGSGGGRGGPIVRDLISYYLSSLQR